MNRSQPDSKSTPAFLSANAFAAQPNSNRNTIVAQQKRMLSEHMQLNSRTTSKGHISRKKNLDQANHTEAAISGQNSLVVFDEEERKENKSAVLHESLNSRDKTASSFMEILRDFNRHQDDVIQSMKTTCEMGELLSKLHERSSHLLV